MAVRVGGGTVHRGLGQLPLAPEILPECVQGEEGARRALLIMIAAKVAALLVDEIGRCWWW